MAITQQSNVVRLQLGVEMLEQEITSLEAYEQVLGSLKGKKPAAILAIHEDWRQRALLRANKRLIPIRAELQRLEGLALERMKAKLTGHAPVSTAPSAATPLMERKPPRKHHQRRHSVERGDRRSAPDRDGGRRSGRKDKNEQRRNRKQRQR